MTAPSFAIEVSAVAPDGQNYALRVTASDREIEQAADVRRLFDVKADVLLSAFLERVPALR